MAFVTNMRIVRPEVARAVLDGVLHHVRRSERLELCAAGEFRRQENLCRPVEEVLRESKRPPSIIRSRMYSRRRLATDEDVIDDAGT